ncbi:hypothetical protein CsatB_015758 [Cannabis sativa]
MEALRATPSFNSPTNYLIPSTLDTKLFHYSKFNTKPNSSSFSFGKRKSSTLSKSKLFKAIASSSSSIELDDPFRPELESTQTPDGKFDWYNNWYPVVPVCDLDKRRPHGKKVMGIDVVVWWDKNESEWKVFDDSCPHRLAPLSEGRIDQWGRLQCVYHGWCFTGSGDCKFIPQAPPEGPPVHTSKKACVASYPSIVQNEILWFWPSTDPQYKDILTKKRPPYIQEIDDPTFSKIAWGHRDFPIGYEVLMENIMDPAHVTYAHYGIIKTPLKKGTSDREGGIPLEIIVENLTHDGFSGKREPAATNKFFAPCLYYSHISLGPKKKLVFVFSCIPVSPGKCRVIWSSVKNFGVLWDKIVPNWISHMDTNIIFDSDLSLLQVEEHRIMDVGRGPWHKEFFVPTKSDAPIIAFRNWLNKYGGGQVDWKGKFTTTTLPPTPPREQLMDRYWSHVVNCPSCSGAHKGLKVLEVVLQVMSIALIGYAAVATKQGQVLKSVMVSIAILAFAASKWLSHLIHKLFHHHDYDHAFQ